MAIKIGNLDISKIYIGEVEVSKIYLGNIEVYGTILELSTPTIFLDKNILKITNITDAEQYKIYVDSNLSYTLNLNLYQINNSLPILKDVTVQQDGTEVIIL